MAVFSPSCARADRRHIAAGAGADHHKIKVESHDLSAPYSNFSIAPEMSSGLVVGANRSTTFTIPADQKTL